MKEETVIFQSKKEMEEVLKKNHILQLRINDQVFNIVNTGKKVVIFEKSCPHMDYPLKQAHVNHLGEIACPWHGYRFSLDTGDEHSNRCRRLRTIPTAWNESGQLVLDARIY